MNDRLMRLIFTLLNMLGVAGVGTYMSGRKRIGVIQIIFSLSFFACTLLPMMYLLHLISQTDRVNFVVWQIGVYQGRYEMRPEYYPPFLIALASMLLFACNLIWSLTTTKPLDSGPPPLP